jgi:hypothetical protein
MVCHCSIPDSSPQPDTKVLHSATPTHPARAMTPAQRRHLALEALAGEFQTRTNYGRLRSFDGWAGFPHAEPSGGGSLRVDPDSNS